MSGDSPSERSRGSDVGGAGGGRDYARVVLVACALLGIVLAGTLVPALSASNGGSGSPIEAALPGEAELPTGGGETEAGAPGGSGETTGGVGSEGGPSQLGALNPGQSTDVGGSIEGAFRSQNASVHLTVESPVGAYWRTGAYGVYTGSGWEQRGPSEAYDGEIPVEGLRGEPVSYEVTLNRSATGLPTVWRPVSVSGRSVGPDALSVTPRRAVLSRNTSPVGTRYAARSVRPPSNVSVLRATGRDYPEAVVDRYGTLPEGVPDRIERFTDRLTRNASGPYEAASTVEGWLERNKTYSLDAERTGEDIADAFIFEMDRGYCEYFATSMVVMLRSQGIPARYTVGYSTGQEVSEDTYSVRAMNAHAWVEVYFEDVGWVKFDPTPGSARLAQEQRSIGRQRPETDYAPTERGSPGERFSPNGTREEEGGANDTEDDTQTTSGLSVSLNRSQPVPGAPVEVSVTDGGEPVSGQTVLFNGEPVGTTGANGTVVAQVPYEQQLRVTLTAAEGGATATRQGRLFAPGGSVVTDATYPVDTNATVSVTGRTLSGSEVTIIATVGGVPIQRATVTVDGQQVTTTDGDGRARIRLPNRTGTVTVGVVRGPVDGATTVDVAALSVTAESVGPLALPGGDAEVRVESGGEPVSGAPVSVDGRNVGVTGADGTTTVTLPFAGSASVVATPPGSGAGPSVDSLPPGQVGRTTVDGLFRNAAVVVLGLVGLVVAVLAVARRRGYGPREVLALLAGLPAAVVRYGKLALVTLVTRGEVALARALARLRTTLAYAWAALRGAVSLAELRARLVAWYRARRGDAAGGPSEPPAGGGEQVEGARLTVREAWARFLTRVSARRASTKTPGELAAHAIERDGLPAEAVGTLRDTFREVEYGRRAADERVERVRRALSRIEGRDRREGED